MSYLVEYYFEYNEEENGDEILFDMISYYNFLLNYESKVVERVMEESMNDNELSKKEQKICLEQRTYDSEIEASCSVCLEKIKKNDSIGVLSCQHFFHYDCINEWGKYKATCPLCLKKIPLEN